MAGGKTRLRAAWVCFCWVGHGYDVRMETFDVKLDGKEISCPLEATAWTTTPSKLANILYTFGRVHVWRRDIHPQKGHSRPDLHKQPLIWITRLMIRDSKKTSLLLQLEYIFRRHVL